MPVNWREVDWSTRWTNTIPPDECDNNNVNMLKHINVWANEWTTNNRLMYHFFNRPKMMRKCVWNKTVQHHTHKHNERTQVERLVWSILRVFLHCFLLLLLHFISRSYTVCSSMAITKIPNFSSIHHTHIGHVEFDLKTYKLRYHKNTHTHSSNNFSHSLSLFHCLFGVLLVFKNALHSLSTSNVYSTKVSMS